mgnify:CR=1 FL=1
MSNKTRAATFLQMAGSGKVREAYDAFVADKASGRFVRPGSLHVPHFKGKYFAIDGGLNVPRPPQGHPVLIQAGSSGPGQALAARSAVTPDDELRPLRRR